jgi:hypothetical protein
MGRERRSLVLHTITEGVIEQLRMGVGAWWGVPSTNPLGSYNGHHNESAQVLALFTSLHGVAQPRPMPLDTAFNEGPEETSPLARELCKAHTMGIQHNHCCS